MSMHYVAVVPLIASCGYIVLIAMVARQNWGTRANQLFIWYVFWLMTWSFGAFMAYADFPFMDTYFWNNLLIIGGLFASVALFHFVRVFLKRSVPRLWLSLGYILCIMAAIAAGMGYIVENAYWSEGAYHLELGMATYAMMSVAFAFTVASMFNLVQGYRAEKDPFARNRIAYPLAGVVVASVLSLTTLLPGWKWYPVDHVGNVINAALLSYAILRYKLLDIQVVFRGGVRYALQTLIIAGIFMLLGIAWLAAHDAIDLMSWGTAIGITLLLAIFFQMLIRWVGGSVGGLFTGGHGDYRSMLRSTSHALGAMPDLEDQASWLVDNLMRTVDTEKGGLFLLDQEQKRYLPRALRGYNNPMVSQMQLEGDNPAVAFLARSDRCLTAEDMEREPQLRAMWKLEREQLAEIEARVLVPVKVKDSLIGVILLGPKRSQRAYSVDDLEFLYSVANQAAVAIENTRLYQEVKERVDWINMISGLTKVIGSSLDLNQVYETFAAGLKKLVDFDRISIGLIEGDKLRFLTVSSEVPTELGMGDIIPLKKSVAAWVIAHETTNIENDFTQERQFPVDETHLRDGLRSAIRVPLFSKGEVFGTLNLTSCRPNAYGDRERKILEQIAGQLAVAIQNSLLYDEAKRAYEDARQAYDELSVAQDYMVRSEKLRALGEMAGGVAHDFNNVLSVILGRAQLALDGVEDPMLKKSLQAIEQAALDAASTVRRLQEFTRVRTDQDFAPVDVSHLVKSALQMAEPRLKEGSEKDGVRIEVSTELNAVNSVRGDVAELREALINMIFNAMDAMPEGGKIMIKTWQGDNQLVLSVADTGVGMSDETKAKVFDPFFTTKGPSGIGLGLSVAYGIVTRHGGNIDVESSLGNGSTFYISLPIGGEKVNSESSSDYPPPTGKGKILMVDDDPDVREVLEMMLVKIGYEVTVVSHGQEAIALFEQSDYNLVIADLGMPDVSGWDVAEAVKRKSPQTPVVLITGWGVQIDKEQRERSGVDGVIAKPVSRQTLFDELERLLEPDK